MTHAFNNHSRLSLLHASPGNAKLFQTQGNENIRPRGTNYSIKGVSSNGLSRGGHSVKSPDPYSVMISLSVYRSVDRGLRQKVNYKPSCDSSASSARVVIDFYCASCWRSPAGAYLPSHPGDAHRTPSVRPYFLSPLKIIPSPM